MSTQEIERVFLLDGMPEDIPSEARARGDSWLVEQGYFPLQADVGSDRHPEGRIRRVRLPDGSERYTHTIKSGIGLVREEQERVIEAGEFHHLWPLTQGLRIRKQRLRIEVDGQLWELDQFLDLEGDLVLAEAELPSVDTPLAIPGWIQRHLVREVTEEPGFRNFHLARSAGYLPPQE